MAVRLSINLPKNAKNSVLETPEIKRFLGEHAPNLHEEARAFGARSSPSPQFPYPGDATAQKYVLSLLETI